MLAEFRYTCENRTMSRRY